MATNVVPAGMTYHQGRRAYREGESLPADHTRRCPGKHGPQVREVEHRRFDCGLRLRERFEMNLRALAEADLSTTLEGDFSAAITLVGPQGAKQTVRGRVRLCKSHPDLGTGDMVVVPDPNVTLRRSSLSPVPATGEKWSVTFPDGPRADAKDVTYLLDTTRALDGGKTLGLIKLPLVVADQAEASS